MSKNAPSRFTVNSLTRMCEMHVVGSLHQGRLTKKVQAILAALPAGTFVKPAKALWSYYLECSGDSVKDAYEIRFVVKDAKAVEAALFGMGR